MNNTNNLAEALDAEYQMLIENDSCFNLKQMNQWIDEAKNRPIPKKLFSEFWFENELCILFADTNVGKSILALQISDAISSGIKINGFAIEIPPQKVIYFDFELSDKQIENRYSENYQNHYTFDPNLLRVEINQSQSVPDNFKDFDNYLCYSLEKLVDEKQAKIIVIDNITYLKSETEKAKDALPLMKLLNSMKKKYGLSILVLAHTPKRNASNPITKNDLSGSKMLMNFCDSCFAIGDSNKEIGLRYIKQIKQRNVEMIYDTNNVVVCRIEKANNFLEFVFVDFDYEVNHLKLRDIDDQIVQIQNLKKEGLSNVKIAEKLSISEGTVRQRVKKLDSK